MPRTFPDLVWVVYMLRCKDGSLYTGITKRLAARIQAHQEGKGARYTKGRGPLLLVYTEPASSHGEALRRELAIKRLSPAQKRALLAAAECSEKVSS
jgi:putative endonuclease